MHEIVAENRTARSKFSTDGCYCCLDDYKTDLISSQATVTIVAFQQSTHSPIPVYLDTQLVPGTICAITLVEI